MIRACAGCGQERHIVARGLCTKCYPAVRRMGKLDKYPRKWNGVDLVDWRRIAEDRKREIDRLREYIKELEHGNT